MKGVRLASLVLLVCASCVYNYNYHSPGGSGGDGGQGGAGGTAGSGGQSGTGGTGSSCTVATEDQNCNGNSCNPVTLECSEFGRWERGPCETCVSDENCWESDHRCVLMEFDGNPYPNDQTGFCLPVANQGSPGGPNCDGEEPYVAVLEDRFSMSGAGPTAYCGVRENLTTCDAVLAQLEERLCTEGHDEECPTGGLCRYTQDNGKWDYRCTYECTSNSECRNQQGWELDCAGYCGT
jgi:hypothetical protein